MAKLRWRGREAAYVPVLDRTVKPDEAVDVPDHLMKRPEYVERGGEKVQIGWLGLEWPKELWATVAEAKQPKTDKE